jgi:hypothetical protein
VNVAAAEHRLQPLEQARRIFRAQFLRHEQDLQPQDRRVKQRRREFDEDAQPAFRLASFVVVQEHAAPVAQIDLHRAAVIRQPGDAFVADLMPVIDAVAANRGRITSAGSSYWFICGVVVGPAARFIHDHWPNAPLPRRRREHVRIATA